MSEEVYKEAREVLENGIEEFAIRKNPLYDKSTKQFSLKIPKSLSLKSDLNKEKEFVMVFNPKTQETKEKINKSKLVIYLKDDEEEKEST